MNENYTLLSIFVFAIFSLFISSENVFATVGGPTYISQIAYNASDDSVYYIEHDYSGKGCPPIIHSVNLAKIQNIEVKTCDEVLQQFFSNGNDGQKYRQFIADTYKNFSYLGSVSLKKNHIDVRAKLLSEHIENGETYWSEFKATITQENKEIAKLNFRGCTKDQPNVFEGYRIPNTDAMAILISNKGDCFEGGYVKENLNIVKGVKYYDTNIVRSIKEESATEPNLGNMVVYAVSEDAGNNNIKNTPTATPAPQKNSVSETILMVAIFIVGTTFGYIVGRKSSRSPSASNFIMGIAGALILAGIAGYFVVNRQTDEPEPIACTQEAKLCPDGSYVGRTGANCEFALCPDVNPDEEQVSLREGQRESSLLVEKIYPDRVEGLNFWEYPVAVDQGHPVTLRIGEIASNGCTITLTLIRIEDNTAVFEKKTDFNRPCPICLAENTLIDTPLGQVPVENIQTGMVVWSVDASGNRVAVEVLKVSKTPVPSTHQVIRVVLHGGRELFASPGHPIGDGRSIYELSPGDLVDGGYVVTAESVPYQKEFTHDILPAGETGFYWANGVLLGSTL